MVVALDRDTLPRHVAESIDIALVIMGLRHPATPRPNHGDRLAEVGGRYSAAACRHDPSTAREIGDIAGAAWDIRILIEDSGLVTMGQAAP